MKSITKEEINALPVLEYTGTIEVIEDLEHARKAIGKLSTEGLLGFDTETRPCFNRGQSYCVSLLQLATETHAYLFRLSKMPFPEELTALLADSNIIKAGVAIQDDVKALQKLHPFKACGFVDLAKEAEKKGVKNFGLRALTAIFLGKRLTKGAKLTNWDRKALTSAQLNYAANDATVGLRIYRKLTEA